MKRLMFSALLLALPMAALAEDAPRRLTVSGEGRVEAVPDMATIHLGVSQRAATAREALEATSAAMAAVFDRLAVAGIAPRDMQTAGLSLNPAWEHHPNNQLPRIIGYDAQNGVTVRVRDLSSLGTVLDAVVSDGANQLHGLRFGLQDPAAQIDEARRRAVAEARRKAELYAEAAGVTLGDLISLDESGGYRPRPEMMMRGAAVAMDAAVPVAEGEVSLSAQVNMVYEIKN